MAIEQLYQAQQSRADATKILPLVVNLADPSPSQGWLGAGAQIAARTAAGRS